MPSTICATVNTSSDTQNGRVVSRAIARDPTMLLTAYQPLALTQFKRAGRYAPRRPKLWRVNESWGIPISGPMLAVSASKPQPMIFPTRMAITPSAKPRPKTIASAPTSQTGSPMLAESQSVNKSRGRPCRSLAETCSIPCGSTVSTCPRYSPPTSTWFSVELTLLIDISFVARIDIRLTDTPPLKRRGVPGSARGLAIAHRWCNSSGSLSPGVSRQAVRSRVPHGTFQSLGQDIESSIMISIQDDATARTDMRTHGKRLQDDRPTSRALLRSELRRHSYDRNGVHPAIGI